MPKQRIGKREFEIGVLKPETVRVYPEPEGAYYSMLMGENPQGQTRSIITRGAGKQWGATRVPLQLLGETAEQLGKAGLKADWTYTKVMSTLGRLNPIQIIWVLLVKMPREGNFMSGWEWNAPGGTQELGETPEDIATREFSEESDLVPLWTGTDFPAWNQYASGCYDEVQSLSVALVCGHPTKLVEGARQWLAVRLDIFRIWAHAQNQLEYPSQWEGSEFCPVDGKVYSLVRSIEADIVRPL